MRSGISPKSKTYLTRAILIGIILYSITTVCYQICTWDLTWDESLTYMQFVKQIFLDSNSVKEGFSIFLERTHHWCAANNHLLNTLGMGFMAFISRRTLGYSHEILLRMPVFLSFLLYVGTALYMYRRKFLKLPGMVLLLSADYVLDFFSVMRGYGIAASLVLLACCLLDTWEEDPDNLRTMLLSLTAITLAITAQTVVLLLAVPFYLYILLRLLERRQFFTCFKLRYLVPILILVVMNLALALYHLTVSAADHCLSPDGNTAYRPVMGMYAQMFWFKCPLIVGVVFAAILLLGIYGLYKKKAAFKDYRFQMIFLIYLIIMIVMTNTVRQGLPVMRLLVSAFPVLVLALDRCLTQIEEFSAKRTGLPGIASSALILLLIISIFAGGNYTFCRDWPMDDGVRDLCYDALEDRTYVVMPEEDWARSASWTFYADQIHTRTGYLIFNEKDAARHGYH